MRNITEKQITPKMAEEMMSRRGQQRKVTDGHVRDLAEIMRRGEWSPNSSDVIMIDTDGVVSNGQHRLLAVMMSGVTITALVETGVPRSAIYDQDQGKRRNIADFLKINGEKNSTVLAGALRWHRLYDTRNFICGNGAGIGWSWPLARAILEQHPMIRESVAFAKNQHIASRLMQPSPYAFFHYITSGRDPQESLWFHEHLINGMDIDDCDPIYTLRNWLIRRLESRGERRGMAGSASGLNLLAALFKTWAAYRAGRELKIIKWTRYGSTAQDFPPLEDELPSPGPRQRTAAKPKLI